MASYNFQPYSGLSPNEVKQRYGYGSKMLQEGSSVAPVGHWTQAIARGLQGLAGGYVSNYAGDQERQGQDAVGKVYKALMDGQATPQQASAALMQTGGWGAEQGQQLANTVIKQRMAQSDPMLALKKRELELRMQLAQSQDARQSRMTALQESQLKNQTPEARAAMAERYGLQPGTPQYQSFVLQGTLPTVGGNQFGRSGTIIQDKAGNFFSVQFGGDGTRRVEPLQINGTGLQPAKGVEQVGDTLRDKATGRVIENVAPNIAGAEQAKLRGRNEAETEASFSKMTQAMNLAKVKWDRVQPAMDRARQLIRSNPTVVGLLGTPQSMIPGSAAFRLRTYLDTIKANIGFQELQAMRDAAPSGASGLGQVTERELNFLQSVISSLDQRLDGPTLLQNLGDVQNSFNRMRSVAEQGYRQTYGKYLKNQPSAPQGTGQAPAAGTYNWTPDGGLQRAR